MSTPTIHNAARKGEFAKTVLMPGDPLRAKFIADTYLDNAKEITHVRGQLGFTGEYLGKRVSVMSSGMGVSSIGIYSHELYNFYGVEAIIRVGSAGAISDRLCLGDIVVALSAHTDSGYAGALGLTQHVCPPCDFALAQSAMAYATKNELRTIAGAVLTSEAFYDGANMAQWQRLNTLAVEMEASALYLNAALAGKKALALLTITDIIGKDKAYSAAQRETQLNAMLQMALTICA